jgi:hypothetical protein
VMASCLYSDGLWAGVRSPAGSRDFSVLYNVQTSSGAYPASYTMGTGVVSMGVKRQGCKAHHLPPPSAEVKNDGATSSLPPCMSWCLIN